MPNHEQRSRCCGVPQPGERFDALIMGFGLAVMTTARIGRTMPAHAPPASP